MTEEEKANIKSKYYDISELFQWVNCKPIYLPDKGVFVIKIPKYKTLKRRIKCKKYTFCINYE